MVEPEQLALEQPAPEQVSPEQVAPEQVVLPGETSEHNLAPATDPITPNSDAISSTGIDDCEETTTPPVDTDSNDRVSASSEAPPAALPVASPAVAVSEADATAKHSNESGNSDEYDKYAKLPVTSYHTDADIYVKVRGHEGEVLYKVLTSNMASASPVWRKMVYSKSFVRPTNRKWVIEMTGPGDDALGLDIIFSIIHWKFHDLPSHPCLEELYAVARVAEKYDCSHVLVPYMEDWMISFNRHCLLFDQKSDHDEKALFVAWAFGEGRWFPKLTTFVAYKSSLGENGVLLDSHGHPWEDRLPDPVVDFVENTREQAVHRLLTNLKNSYEQLVMVTPEDSTKFCLAKGADDTIKEQCQVQQLGSLINGLTWAGLMPIPSPETYQGTVSELSAKIRGMKILYYKVPGSKPHQDFHINCGGKHKEAVTEATPSTVKLDSELIVELKSRAYRCGAYVEIHFHPYGEKMDSVAEARLLQTLREDGHRFKQQEDFVTAPDYYSESSH
ncbi:hypothetical protein QBC47DRAFT_429921 [Echria macrotheca]|uniref:BTB domain-containing protein n=1 Tax=Echria macrotheca TaxID=438768 RepID=A0AAJ0BBY6_9PEZI|nr:hypothetical protein QBC47DRAFT_429921 [Echria macrotheca]